MSLRERAAAAAAVSDRHVIEVDLQEWLDCLSAAVVPTDRRKARMLQELKQGAANAVGSSTPLEKLGEIEIPTPLRVGLIAAQVLAVLDMAPAASPVPAAARPAPAAKSKAAE